MQHTIPNVFHIERNMSGKTKASPEIRVLIDKLTDTKNVNTSQSKYEAILARKCYDHHCFLECVMLRLDSHRGVQETCSVQKEADKTFIHMLEHAI
jgi:hypothetical protein